MSDNEMKLDEFPASDGPLPEAHLDEDKTASDLAPVFDVPVPLPHVYQRPVGTLTLQIRAPSGKLVWGTISLDL